MTPNTRATQDNRSKALGTLYDNYNALLAKLDDDAANTALNDTDYESTLTATKPRLA